MIPQTKDKIRRKTKGVLTQEGMDINFFLLFLGLVFKACLEGEVGREEETPLNNARNLLQTCPLNGPT